MYAKSASKPSARPPEPAPRVIGSAACNAADRVVIEMLVMILPCPESFLTTEVEV